jgi:hypothetical protein
MDLFKLERERERLTMFIEKDGFTTTTSRQKISLNW